MLPHNYIDDILVHSANKMEHLLHLKEVFDRLHQANLSLRGRKYHIAMSQVPYLGHVFSGTGMSPDQQKVAAVKDWPIVDLYAAQQADPITKQIDDALQSSPDKPRGQQWHHPPLLCFCQLWTQLTRKDGVICHRYKPEPSGEVITVPILPSSMQHSTLYRCHNSPAAGHQGVDKTLNHLKFEGYWPKTLRDIVENV